MMIISYQPPPIQKKPQPPKNPNKKREPPHAPCKLSTLILENLWRNDVLLPHSFFFAFKGKVRKAYVFAMLNMLSDVDKTHH